MRRFAETKHRVVVQSSQAREPDCVRFVTDFPIQALLISRRLGWPCRSEVGHLECLG